MKIALVGAACPEPVDGMTLIDVGVGTEENTPPPPPDDDPPPPPPDEGGGGVGVGAGDGVNEAGVFTVTMVISEYSPSSA